jgi:hypothetical protein
MTSPKSRKQNFNSVMNIQITNNFPLLLLNNKIQPSQTPHQKNFHIFILIGIKNLCEQAISADFAFNEGFFIMFSELV